MMLKRLNSGIAVLAAICRTVSFFEAADTARKLAAGRAEFMRAFFDRLNAEQEGLV